MPPISSPPPAQPGPPWTNPASGDPCPVDVLAERRLPISTRPWNGATPSTTSSATFGSSVKMDETSEPLAQLGQFDRLADIVIGSTVETGPNASTSCTLVAPNGSSA
jgi:hypothetical protein